MEAVAARRPPGQRIRLWLVWNGREARDLARELGVSATYLSNVLRGRRVPSPELRLRIREVVGVEPEEWEAVAPEIRAKRRAS